MSDTANPSREHKVVMLRRPSRPRSLRQRGRRKVRERERADDVESVPILAAHCTLAWASGTCGSAPSVGKRREARMDTGLRARVHLFTSQVTGDTVREEARYERLDVGGASPGVEQRSSSRRHARVSPIRGVPIPYAAIVPRRTAVCPARTPALSRIQSWSPTSPRSMLLASRVGVFSSISRFTTPKPGGSQQGKRGRDLDRGAVAGPIRTPPLPVMAQASCPVASTPRRPRDSAFGLRPGSIVLYTARRGARRHGRCRWHAAPYHDAGARRLWPLRGRSRTATRGGGHRLPAVMPKSPLIVPTSASSGLVDPSICAARASVRTDRTGDGDGKLLHQVGGFRPNATPQPCALLRKRVQQAQPRQNGFFKKLFPHTILIRRACARCTRENENSPQPRGCL